MKLAYELHRRGKTNQHVSERQTTTNKRRDVMYKLTWKTQSSDTARDEMHETLESAVNEFREVLRSLYAHSGGMVAILEERHFETEAQALVRWEEHISGGFGSGTVWTDVNPLESLNRECENEGCCWHNESGRELCEECEHEGLDMILDYMVR